MLRIYRKGPASENNFLFKNVRAGMLLRWVALKNIFKSELKDGMITLDIGGYDGYISYRLKKIFPNLKITVVDLDSSGLGLANKLNLKTLNASAIKLPLRDGRIDAILCLDLIEHIKDDNELIKEMSRILKNDAKVILTTPMHNGISFPFLDKEKTDSYNKDIGHLRKGYTLEMLRSLFEAYNLSILKSTRYFNILSRFIYWLVNFSFFPLKGKHLLFRIVIRLEPYLKYRAQEHIIIAKKTSQLQ